MLTFIFNFVTKWEFSLEIVLFSLFVCWLLSRCYYFICWTDRIRIYGVNISFQRTEKKHAYLEIILILILCRDRIFECWCVRFKIRWSVYLLHVYPWSKNKWLRIQASCRIFCLYMHLFWMQHPTFCHVK